MKTSQNWPQPRPIDEPALTDVVYFTRFTDCVGLLQLLEPDAWPQPEEVRGDY